MIDHEAWWMYLNKTYKNVGPSLYIKRGRGDFTVFTTVSNTIHWFNGPYQGQSCLPREKAIEFAHLCHKELEKPDPMRALLSDGRTPMFRHTPCLNTIMYFGLYGRLPKGRADSDLVNL